MARKRALVVDDSRSARLILRKMLEKHAIEVDTAGSAEEALDYLLHTHPSVIFMDHMMPGMDGFQAVQAIKSNPRTATIPIMMYTSKGDDVYLGEARALGAVGVLPKEVKPADLIHVLETLHLLPDQAEQVAVAEAAPVIEPPPSRAPSRQLAPEPELAADVRIAALAREAAEDAIQHYLRGALDEMRNRLRRDLREELEAHQEMDEEAVPPPPPQRRRTGLWAALLIVLIALPLAYWLWQGRSQPQPQTVAATPATRPVPASTSRDNPAVLKLQQARAENEKTQLLRTLEWALNQSGEFDYGQVPFGEEQLATLSELLTRLGAAGFEGVIRLEAHLGQFCTVRDSNGDPRPAPPATPINRCDAVGMDREQAIAFSGRQSLAFANFLASSPVLRSGKIKVQLVPKGEDEPRYEYPAASTASNAGQWNAIARRNQRVEVTLIPSP